MSCPCTQTSNISENCTVCGNICDNCSCEQYLTPPVVECPDPVQCDQVYSTDCVVYNGESIQCSLDAYQLYPNVNHHIVLSTASEQQRTVNAMLNNINMQLCYIFSKDYIANMLTIINNDPDLKLLFCQIVNSCDCDCSLTCPTVTNIEYVTDTPLDKMEVTFDLPTGGTAPYNYKVAVYSKLPNGQYTYISGQVSTTVSVVGSSGVSLVNLGTSGTSGSDYVVSVFVEDSLLCSAGYFNNSSTPFNYSDVQNNCGVGFYQGVAAPLNCCLECNSGQTFTLNTVDNRLVHTFDVPTLGVNCHPITSYTVHWYKYNGSNAYNYIDSETHLAPYTTPTIVTQLLSTVPTDQILVIILTETADPTCFTGVEPRVGGYFTTAELTLLDPNDCFSFTFEPTITPL